MTAPEVAALLGQVGRHRCPAGSARRASAARSPARRATSSAWPNRAPGLRRRRPARCAKHSPGASAPGSPPRHGRCRAPGARRRRPLAAGRQVIGVVGLEQPELRWLSRFKVGIAKLARQRQTALGRRPRGGKLPHLGAALERARLSARACRDRSPAASATASAAAASAPAASRSPKGQIHLRAPIAQIELKRGRQVWLGQTRRSRARARPCCRRRRGAWSAEDLTPRPPSPWGKGVPLGRFDGVKFNHVFHFFRI